jgi:hypothetical protein
MQISLVFRGLPAIMSAVVYCYYRLGWDSTTIAEEFGIKPPHVRIVLYRLNQLADGRRRSPYRPYKPKAERAPKPERVPKAWLNACSRFLRTRSARTTAPGADRPHRGGGSR